MKGLNFENAFSPVPSIVHTRVLGTLEEVNTVKKAKPIAALVLAAVLLMALAGVAFATVQSGVLDFIFHSGQRTQEQMDLVQPLGLIHEANDVATTLTDAMLSGNMLSVAFDFQSEKDFYIITDSVTIDGVELAMADSNIVNMWHGTHYKAEQAFSTRGFKGYLDTAVHGTPEVKIHLTFLTPKRELVPIENVTASYNSKKVWEAIDACVAAGNTPMEAESGYILVDHTWLESFHDFTPAFQHPVNDAKAHIEHSNMEVLDSFEFTFQLSASQSDKTDITPKPIHDGRTIITFREVSLSPTETVFDFTIAPEPNFMTLEKIETIFPFFAFYGYYELDAPPVLLEFADMTYAGESFMEEQADGTMALRVTYRMPALEKPTNHFVLVPYTHESGEDNPLWEYAIQV